MKSTYNRKTRAKEIFDKVVCNVRNIIQNGEYEKYLKFQNKFTKYSFNNTILIFSQFPDATNVAGKAKWKELGRELIKDAKRIQITAGMPVQAKTKVKKIVDGKEVEEEQTYTYIAYKSVYVYDISQTIGEPIPLEVKMLDSENMGSFFDKLRQFSKFPVYEKELEQGIKGYYSPRYKEISIEKRMSVDAKTAVLLHELTHGLYDDFDYKTDRNLSEVFVESVAYMVADYFGLDNSMCSFNYITQYANGDPKILIDLGKKIKKCATDFIKELEEFEVQQEEQLAA